MKKVVIWIALSLWSVMTVFAGETAYLFSYFINDSKDGLHLAYRTGLSDMPLPAIWFIGVSNKQSL